MDFTQKYTTQSGKQYLIRLNYNENIQEREGFGQFLRSLEVLDSESRSTSLPVSASQFSTYEDYTTFGSYSAINYLGVREAAMDGLRLKILTRIQDHLEAMG